jgi:uncharacterized protein DUF4760
MVMVQGFMGLVVAWFACVVYFAYYGTLLKKFSQFDSTEWCLVLFIPVLGVCFHLLRRYKKQAKLNSRDILWLSITAVSIIVAGSLIFFVRTETGVAILLAAYLATMGWLYTNYMNSIIQRKAHTMNVLIQQRNSTEFNRNRSLVLAKFPFGRRVTTNDLAELKRERADATAYTPDKVPTLDSAYYIANYLEFISVGVLNGDLDDTLIERTFRGIFVNWFEHLQPVIYDAQVESSGVKNEKIFLAFITLVEKYKSLRP